MIEIYRGCSNHWAGRLKSLLVYVQIVCKRSEAGHAAIVINAIMREHESDVEA